MLRKKTELADKWTVNFDEVSNNVYKVELTDTFGRKAGTTDHDLDRAIETCLSYAFDIEKQLNNPLNKFIYDTFKYFLSDQTLLSDNYSGKDFGSWIIEKNEKRIILDGKESLLALQSQTASNVWVDDFTIKVRELTFEQLKELRDNFKNGE
ncbi:MAG TPA: hypothetical protein VK541_24790 [Pedobacter sp.]|uniref:hypothetical protein n=1 Tax=Pedobacter sp. TaxID=1411316 RepID=UPI002CD3C287|nr:hypothetical protein [Pedobacter sp.]HMI05729.1 hypothetical protein [Pedobacter sp.]